MQLGPDLIDLKQLWCISGILLIAYQTHPYSTSGIMVTFFWCWFMLMILLLLVQILL